ncbi:hypothetical protein [Nonomuraea dietziae]|uniref:hypothetical protein n=1 Tax=Nonomuraea dietziae TaxID=65515 RepID=UPI0031D5F40A
MSDSAPGRAQQVVDVLGGHRRHVGVGQVGPRRCRRVRARPTYGGAWIDEQPCL